MVRRGRFVSVVWVSLVKDGSEALAGKKLTVKLQIDTKRLFMQLSCSSDSLGESEQ